MDCRKKKKIVLKKTIPEICDWGPLKSTWSHRLVIFEINYFWDMYQKETVGEWANYKGNQIYIAKRNSLNPDIKASWEEIDAAKESIPSWIISVS